ncbi:helix-turn-helix domain-containing protein [Salinicola halophyticus]|uniref:helix-turn-helix domain-containing protein n=1 Tax=Salinicola halophyticus TaxID=1808881 RepID=UPI000DA1E410|nr:helix-turn-helix transcriptional regulator [Salinicola halophyticus]
MSSELAKRMREIREAETSGRHEFSQLIGVAKKTVESIEQSGRAPKGEMLEAICIQWPKYSLWLMTGQVNEAAGQVSPEIERTRDRLKPTGTDTGSRGE